MNKKKLLIILLTVVLSLFAVMMSILGHFEYKYTRIGDCELDIINNQSRKVHVGYHYDITTYNIGFGAYDRDFSFFMDEGESLDGVVTKGKYGKGVSKENTIKNTKGVIEVLEYLDSDFYLLQEIDTDSSRSYRYNQMGVVSNHFYTHGNTFASNFHSAYMPYPLHDMHGIVNSGILTMSKLNMSSSERLELPVTTAFIDKYFDLDRCINVTRYKTDNDKELVIVNTHLSAYDEGGVYRKLQIELLFNLISSEYEKGNYVIAGGDFNHDIANSLNLFPTNKKVPDWISVLNESELPLGFNIASSNSHPTCRDSDTPYVLGDNYTAVVDGFIFSNNIQLLDVTNIVFMDELDISFMYSDHNPVNFEFYLKS